MWWLLCWVHGRAAGGPTVPRCSLPPMMAGLEAQAAQPVLCSTAAAPPPLLQLPLPRHLSEEMVMEHLEPQKDVDGFHPLNMGCAGRTSLSAHSLDRFFELF